LKASLLFEAGTVVMDVPFVEGEVSLAGDERALEPSRTVVLVPISSVNDATMRAVVYARSLHAFDAEAVFMVMDPEEQADVIRGWHERHADIPLVIVDAAFRDLTGPLLREVRRHTARVGTVVTVVVPELVPRHWWENVLHNERSLSPPGSGDRREHGRRFVT
jgi:hypothetical protein